MTTRGRLERGRDPTTLTGYVLSVVTIVAFGGVVAVTLLVGASLTRSDLSSRWALGGLVVGALAGGGILAVRFRSALHDRWRASGAVRALVLVGVGGTFAILGALAPAAVAIGYAVTALLLIAGQTAVYLNG